MLNAVETIKESMKQLLHEQHNEWRKIVSGLNAEALNWKPGDDTNSLAALVAHTCDAERFLMAIAVGIKLDRDREANRPGLGPRGATLTATRQRFPGPGSRRLGRVQRSGCGPASTPPGS